MYHPPVADISAYNAKGSKASMRRAIGTTVPGAMITELLDSEAESDDVGFGAELARMSCQIERAFRFVEVLKKAAAEALALKWSDFDRTNKKLRIERALEYTKKYGLRFKVPKSERGKRTIVLDDFLVELLARMREQY